MTSSNQETIHSKYDIICNSIINTYPILAPTWSSALERFGTTWLSEFIDNLETIFGCISIDSPNPGLVDAIDGYAEFCNDSLRNQAFFEKHGRYRSSSYSECLDSFYNNEEHMMKCYLPGMWVSHYLWPQHYNMLVGFRSGTLRRLGTSNKLFYEVGVGCGMYSKTILDSIPGIRGIGIDISEYSLRFTQSMVNQFGYESRYNTLKHDVYLGIDEQADFLVCQEVLEHLEDPDSFCKALFDMVCPGGHAYITAALNAAHSDHIYLFSQPLELEEMLRNAGFIPMGLQEEFAAGVKPRNITPSLAGYYCLKP